MLDAAQYRGLFGYDSEPSCQIEDLTLCFDY